MAPTSVEDLHALSRAQLLKLAASLGVPLHATLKVRSALDDAPGQAGTLGGQGDENGASADGRAGRARRRVVDLPMC